MAWVSPSLDLNPHPFFPPLGSGGWHERVVIDQDALLSMFNVVSGWFAPMVTVNPRLKICLNALFPIPVPSLRVVCGLETRLKTVYCVQTQCR